MLLGGARIARHALGILAALVLLSSPGWAQALVCSGEAFAIKDAAAQLTQIDQTVSPVVLVNIGGPEAGSNNINNIGFNKSNGLIYGYRRTGTVEIVSMDQTGASGLTGLGTGALPAAAGAEYNAGDVSPDGSLMYFNTGGAGALHTINLPALTLNTTCTITGGTGQVADWAAHPTNGLLYGGDDAGGQLAVVDPTTCVRTDSTLTPPLPTGSGFGVAWFDGSGKLYLYQNSGQIYEVDIGSMTSTAGDTGPSAGFTDGAACIQDLLGAAKDVFSSAGNGLPSTITLDFVFENFSGVDTLTGMSAVDDLAAVFGTHGVDWTFTSISSVPAAFANPGFNGHSDTQLVNQAPTQSLAPSAVVTVTVTFTLLTHSAAVGDMYVNQVDGMGDSGGLTYSDLSTDGLDPDPNGDGNATGERDAAVLTVPVELMEFSIE